VKRLVDRDPTKGRIVLTGSANYLAARSVTETLAGRAGRIELWPLSVGERSGHRERFVETAFHTTVPAVSGEGGRTSRAEIMSLILEGGYPEVVRDRLRPSRRTRWFDAYVEDVVNREALRPLADVRQEHDLRRVLGALAARVGSELVISDLARDLGLDRATVTSYVSLLEALYLVHLLPAFSTNAVTAAKRRPTIHLNDTGLAANLTGLGERDLSALTAHRLAGPLLEQFVVVELMKQRSWSGRPVDLRHYRDREGREVDVILEDRRSGEIVGIEVKSTSTPTLADARHLRYLRDRLGPRFVAGIVLHLGAQTLPLDDRIRCQPVSTLWESGAEPHR
jgi:predicted AAA+ superfamily ATPase